MRDKSVKGFNIGTNSGKVAGQSINHCHIHLIPRRKGDVSDSTGGVRGVIPEKANYKKNSFYTFLGRSKFMVPNFK